MKKKICKLSIRTKAHCSAMFDFYLHSA